MSKRSIFFRLVGVVLTLLMAAAYSFPVQAHANLVRSDPPNNAVLDQAPRQVRLWFSETLAGKFSSVRMLDMNGRTIEGVQISQDSNDPYLLVVDLPVLGKGIYSLNWKVLSGSDGHPTQGLLVFGINQTPANNPSSEAAFDPGPDLFQEMARALVDIALCGLFGILAISLALLFPAGGTAGPLQRLSDHFRRRAIYWAVGMAMVAVVAGLLQWFFQIGGSPNSESAGTVVKWSEGVALLTTTPWGLSWLARQGALLATAGYLWARRRPMARGVSRPGWAVAAVLASLPLAAYALSTHAAGLSAPLLPLLADFIHLLAASLWVGGLTGLVAVLVPVARREQGAREFFQSIWTKFGRFAVVAVGLTITTGLFNTSNLVASTSALTDSAYGQSLLLKVGFVAVIGLIGLGNSLVLHPALYTPLGRVLRRPHGWRPFDRKYLPATIAVEGIVGLTTILLAGILASNSPANSPDYLYAGVDQPETLTQNVDDLVVSLAVEPNQAGQNIIDVRATSTRRPAPAEILRVILRISYLGEPLGTQSADAALIDPGLYRLGGSYFSLPGPWKVDVVVRRKGIPDSVSTFNWNVLPAGKPPSGINIPLQEPLWIAAGLLLALTLGAAFLLFRK